MAISRCSFTGKEGASVRIPGTNYTRLHDADLVAIAGVRRRFPAALKGLNWRAPEYAGEQDLFCFLIDPNGWTEIEGEAFCAGFFIWNSEVGKAFDQDRDVLVPDGVPEPHRLGCH